MKYTTCLVGILVLSIGVGASAISNPAIASTPVMESSKFFRHLMFRESPYAPYKGIHPISASEAKTSAHYKFDYDSKGRVVAIAHQIGNEVIADNGNWDSFIWFAPKVTIEYGKNHQIHRYYDVENQQIEAHGKVYRAEYKLANGERIELKFYDKEGNPSQNAWNAHQYQWQHDNEGRVIEKRYGLDGQLVSIRPQFEFYETRLDYDQQGRLQFMYNYGTTGESTNNPSGAGIDRIFYDLDGNFQRWHVYDKDGNPVEGNRPMVHIGEHLYDSLGNKIGMRGFDKHGAPMKFAWGDFLLKHDYDSFGNQTGTQVFDEMGQQKMHAVVEYSEDGLQRKWIKFVNEQGELIASPQLGGAAALEFHYEDGKKIANGRSRYDTNMKKLEN